MSNGTSPCSGYVLPASNLSKFGLNEVELIQLCLDNGAGSKSVTTLDDALNFIVEENVTVPLKLDGVISVNCDLFFYDPDQGDQFDELSEGYYIIVEEDDLYERQLSVTGEMLSEKGLLPEKKSWTRYS